MNKKWFTAEDFKNFNASNCADIANARLQGLYRALEVCEEALRSVEEWGCGSERAKATWNCTSAGKARTALETVKGILTERSEGLQGEKE